MGETQLSSLYMNVNFVEDFLLVPLNEYIIQKTYVTLLQGKIQQKQMFLLLFWSKKHRRSIVNLFEKHITEWTFVIDSSVFYEPAKTRIHFRFWEYTAELYGPIYIVSNLDWITWWLVFYWSLLSFSF